MANIFLIGDTHFGHPLVSGLRGFATVEEHDEEVISRWNSVVREFDHVYHLGDVAMRQKALVQVGRLKGKLRLVRGNHDIYKTKEYLVYFKEIHGARVIDNMVLTHIPVHEMSVGRYTANVHGHLHGGTVEDRRYFCASWENVGGVPVSLETVKKRVITGGSDGV